MTQEKIKAIQERLNSLKKMGNVLFENRPVNKKIIGQNILLQVIKIEEQLEQWIK